MGADSAVENIRVGMDLTRRNQVDITTTMGADSAVENARVGMARGSAGRVVMAAAVATRSESPWF